MRILSDRKNTSQRNLSKKLLKITKTYFNNLDNRKVTDSFLTNSQKARK